MSARQGRRSSRRSRRSTFVSPGRLPHKRSTPDHVLRARRDIAMRKRPRDVHAPILLHDRLADATRTGCWVAFFLGTTAATVISGLTLVFDIALRENPALKAFAPSGVTIVSTSLLALAVGIRVPQRIAIWVGRFARRHVVRDGSEQPAPDAVVRPGAPERKLYWTAFSFVSLAAGVSVALLPVWVLAVLRVDACMHAHFVWSHVPLATLNLGVSFLAGFIPLALLGLALSCTHHLCCPHGQWDTRATAWALVGAGVGIGLVDRWTVSTGKMPPMLIAAAIPPLLLAIGAAWLGSNGDSCAPPAVDTATDPLPTSSDRWPTLLRASIIAVGGGSVCAMTVAADWLSGGDATGFRVLSPLVLATGIGIALGARSRQAIPHTIGAFGMCCAFAGVAVGFMTYALAVGSAVRLWLAIPLAMCGTAAIGYATSYGRTVLLSRVARRSSAGARTLTYQLICAAATVMFAVPLAVYFFREPATLMLLSMSLIALGGLLVIYEPSYAPRVRRARLKAVYGSLAAMILLASVAAVSRVSPSPIELSGDSRSAPTATRSHRNHEITENDR